MTTGPSSRPPSKVSVSELAGFELLTGVGAPARRELLGAAEDRELETGEVLIAQGAENRAMYLVIEGRLGVFLDHVEGDAVAELGAGEAVGELSVLDGAPASAHVRALEPCRILVVGEDAFWHLTNVSHGFAVNLLIKLASRLRANNATVSRNVQQRRQYERAAMFDGLTGIHNRRWLDETLHRMLRRHARGGGPLSLSLIDIDHFKTFNDRHGHDAGDHVLTLVASTISENLRPTDLVARFGGEEFVIIFPDTSLEPATIAAERVRQAVSEVEPTMPDGRPLPRVTISMGVTQLEAGQGAADLLKTADRAMYAAKAGGRNKVCVGHPDASSRAS